MDRDEIIRMIQLAAKNLCVDHLSRDAFCQHSGIYKAAIHKYFDSWSDACNEAGVKCGLNITNKYRIKPTPISEDDCIRELKRVAALLNRKDLSSKLFNKHAKFSCKPVIIRFGSWHNALQKAGLELCEKSKKEVPLSLDECITEIKRVANLLNSDYLTASNFDKHANFTSYRVVRSCGTWHAALEKAGINVSPFFIKEIPLHKLANDFLKVAIQVNRVPTIIQLVRRSTPVSHTFSNKFGGYKEFKIRAIDFLFSSNAKMPSNIRNILELERQKLENGGLKKQSVETVSTPYHQGRTLNFRAFVYAPTYENDVIGLFSAVAEELGFEILCNRTVFPDCEARRKIPGRRGRFKKCLIEFEFSSLDYKTHGHSISGCDLIVCWIHNWKECPIEVMELEKEIRRLPGWK